MNKKTKLYIIPIIIVLIALISVGVVATYKIIHQETISTTSNIEIKNGKTESSINNTENTVEEETENIQNANFEDLICQSAMIVGINKAIEESQTEEIEDSEEDVVEEETASTSGYPYYIKVNYYANVVTIYGLDSSGNYTVPVKAMICSTGRATPTSGVYRTQAKYQWKILNGGVYGQYSTRITGSILFHSVPYSTNSKNALISKYYDQLGTRASAGCVRLTTIDAKWIYDNCPIGTQVEFYSSSDPGPLGKPTAKKISSYPSYLKCWDPTDPDPKNPWLTYTETETTDEETQDNTTTQESTDTTDSSKSNETSSSGNTASSNTASGNTASGNTSSGNTASGNTASGNTTSGNTASGNTTSGNTASGNTASGNTASSNTASNNTTSDNTTNTNINNTVENNNTN